MTIWKKNASSGLSILQGEMCDAFMNIQQEYKNKCHTSSKTYFKRWVQMRFSQKWPIYMTLGKKQLKNAASGLSILQGEMCVAFLSVQKIIKE